MAILAARVCPRLAVAPRLAVIVGQHRGNVAGRLRKEVNTPPHRPTQPRRISMTTTGHAPEGVPFEELVVLLEAQYGLAERFVRGSLSELAEILGYHASVDPIIQYGDASILLEEIGAPPLTPEQFGEFKASMVNLQQEMGETKDVRASRKDNSTDGEEHVDEELPIIQSTQKQLPEVIVDRPPRLFRGR